MRSALAALPALAAHLVLAALLAAGCDRQPVSLLDAGRADIGAARDSGRDRRLTEGGPPLTEALEVVAEVAWETTLHCKGVGAKVRFTLLPSPGGALIAPYALTAHEAPWVRTSLAPGSIAGGVLRLGPFTVKFTSDVSTLQWIHGLEVTELEARFDAATRTLEGTLSGQVTCLDEDVMDHAPMTATLIGRPDVTPPLLKPTALPSPEVVTRVPELGFSEPVQLAEGATLATLTAGPVVITVPFAGGDDPGRTMGHVLFPLPGHLPFGVTVTVAVASAATDLAGNAVAAPLTASYQTIADPGLLANPGFEAGAAGFVTIGAPLQIIEQTAEYPAKEGTRYARWEPSLTASSVTFRLSLPASARKIVLAVDGHSSAAPPGMSVSLIAATTSARVTSWLQLPSPTLPGPLGLKRTGWTDVALDVSALAGAEVAVTLDHLVTGYFGKFFLDLDDLRVEDH